MKRSNILWISFEDTNPFYGCYGDKVARTPNLDKFAAEGCIWSNAFSTAGVCAPARSAVITGMYPTSIGTHHMRTSHTNPAAPELPTPYSAVPPHYVKCFSEYLRAEGYYCTNNEKTDYQFAAPFTAWDELGAKAHWRNRKCKDQPFFAVFNPTRTHESGMWKKNCTEHKFNPAKIKLPPYFPDTQEVRETMARMYTNIELSDAYFGELLKQLEEGGLAENTIVFHWSDHGPMPRGKRWPYDSGIRVPMIIRWPGKIKAGTSSKRLVSTIDLGPTVLSLAGIEVPAHMQGQAFLGEQKKAPRKYVFASRDRYDESYDMVRAVRDNRFKYIRNYHPELPYNIWIPYLNRHPIMQEMWKLYAEGKLEGPQKLLFQDRRPVDELYDTQKDPWEINNLAGNSKYRKEIERLGKALDKWMDEVGDMGEIDEAVMVRAWYPNGVQPETAAPVFVPICGELPGVEPADLEIDLKSPALLQIYCTTQGASIGYTFDKGNVSAWNLYSGPLRLAEKGSVTIRAKSIRIGFKESQESKLVVNII